MNYKFRLLALLLAILMTLCACNTVTDTDSASETGSETATVAPGTQNTETAEKTESETEEDTKEEETVDPYANERPEISRSRGEIEEMITVTDDDFAAALAAVAAFEECARVSDSEEEVDLIYDPMEDLFDFISTQVQLANMVYYMDVTNEAASERYLSYFDKYTEISDAYNESCKIVYQESPIRDVLFADWSEQDIEDLLNFDPEINELRLANEELQVEINELSDDEFYDRSAEIYAEIVTNNNRLAELYGYDNYYDYATERVYGRDYTRADVESFADSVVEIYYPAYKELSKKWLQMQNISRTDYFELLKILNYEFDSLSVNYLEEYINSYDNSVKEGLSHPFENRNLYFASSMNSEDAAYEVYLRDFESPFCYFGYGVQSLFTVTHEIGHYYADLHCTDVDCYDVLESHSQANEYLLLEYLSDHIGGDVYEALRVYKLMDSMLYTIVGVIVDEFEREVYSLESVEGYGSAEFDAIMEKVCEKYGGYRYVASSIFDAKNYWRRVAPNNPVYYISYATSLTVSLEIYAEACEDRDAAREIYRKLVEEATPEDGFSGLMEKIGLFDPFARETIETIAGVLVVKDEE